MDLLKEFGLKERDKKSYAIIGACMEVHKVLGAGFLEKVYQDALEVEFKRRNIPYEREKMFKIIYKGVELQHVFQSDFVCYDEYIVELKAVKELDDIHRAQVINYLHASGLEHSLLINFGETSLRYERYIN